MLLRNEEVREYIRTRGIRYFNADEFKCKHCGEILIESSLIDILEELREHLGKPIKITSAYRCPIHNKRVGGVRNSSHVKGLAVDIRATNSRDRHKIISFLVSKGVNRIGIADSFIHFDLDPEKPQGVVWLYRKGLARRGGLQKALGVLFILGGLVLLKMINTS